ncbi:tape measure domain-containing protein [Avibacterium paragallinarum]|uniref:Tape measure domain-containing protein n=1 Tax=Avibacterium paragallinarum TaxID=728 RepID=A0A8B3TKQ9_AVIPA|nr:tape measure domain-containing protein [Avibacterium paragallinarum]
MGSLSNKINGIGNITIPVLGIGAVAGVTTVGKSLLRTAADFEMAGIRMKQTFGERGDEALAWLKEFATETPMAFGEVQNAAMKLMTAGIDPMNGSLQALVDYNAKIGGNAHQLNEIINSFQKMSATGKMTWEDVLPLLQRNIPVLKLLAKATGNKYNDKQILQMIKEGKMGAKAIKALYTQMGKDAAGSAKEQMKTWDGLVSNLGDTWTAMQARFMEHGAFDALKQEMGSLLAWLNEKMDDGTLDEFAQKVSDVLITALNDLKSMAKDVRPVLESIGSVMSWLSEKAGGYGNIAKFAAALYGANKIARLGFGLGKGMYGFGKGTYGAGSTLWAAGKTLLGRGNVVNSAANAVAGAEGVQSVYVVNMPDMGGFGGGKKRRNRRNQRKNSRPNRSISPQKQMKKVNTPSNNAMPKPKVFPTGQKLANGVKQATSAMKNTSLNVAKSTASITKSATTAIGKTVGKALPLVNTGLAIAQGAAVLLDDEASTKEKSESIGSIAGATAGAFIGQALIPIPVVGAAIGGFLGETIGGWLGEKVGEVIEDKPTQPPAEKLSSAVQNVGQAVGHFVSGEVGEKLASINPIDTKLNGLIEVKVKASEGLVTSVAKSNLNTNQANSSLGLSVLMGNSGQGLYGGA